MSSGCLIPTLGVISVYLFLNCVNSETTQHAQEQTGVRTTRSVHLYPGAGSNFLDKRPAFDMPRFGKRGGFDMPRFGKRSGFDMPRFGKRSGFDMPRFGKRGFDMPRFGKRVPMAATTNSGITPIVIGTRGFDMPRFGKRGFDMPRFGKRPSFDMPRFGKRVISGFDMPRFG